MIGAVAGALLLVGVPLVIGGAFLVSGSDEATDVPADEPAPADPDGAPGDARPEGDDDPADRTLDGEDAGPRPDREVPADERIPPPDLDDLGADDARVAELLLDIDAAERVMLGYQLETQKAFRDDLDPDEPDELLRAVGAAARTALDDLEVLRGRLAAPQPDPAAADVRDGYVEHLDSWADYLSAIEDDPQILLGDLTRYTVHINRTGDGFARAVDGLLQTDVDAAVGRYAQQIVDRGFSGPETPQA